MALIKNANGRKDGSYSRLFGNEELGRLISRVHGAVISSGTELEKTIIQKIEKNIIPDLDKFLKEERKQDGLYFASKKAIKKSTILKSDKAEPDFVLFKKDTCHVIELKDGDAFDTKKSEGEHANMLRFIEKNSREIKYIVTAHFCCFNQNDQNKVQQGFKNKIALKEAMTGRQFCELLEINYDEIVAERHKEASQQITYFLSTLFELDVVKKWMKDNLQS